MGLMLAFEIRFCRRETVFQNHILDRSTGPGFGVVWKRTSTLIAGSRDVAPCHLERGGAIEKRYRVT